jgi:acetylornithine deacetylase/succinyl-diaminopimelate desuccinylase-like protein
MSLADQVQAQLPGVLADLRELVAIESVSADSARAAEVERSAERIVDLLMDLRCPDVRVIRVKEGSAGRHWSIPSTRGQADRVSLRAP